MTIDVEKKEIRAVALTPIVQQTAFWAEVKSYQGIESKSFDFKKASDIKYPKLSKPIKIKNPKINVGKILTLSIYIL